MKSIKRFFAAALTVLMISMVYVQAYAAPVTPNNTVLVVMDGKLIDFQDTSAQIIHDYTYVPIARIIEILTDLRPEWNDATKCASFLFNGKNYQIYASQKGIYVDGAFREFEAPPEIVNERVLIPLRMLTNALEFGLQWDEATRTVHLTSPTFVGERATVLAVDPVNVSVNNGSQVTVTVTASGNATTARIVDAFNNTVAESKSYRASGVNNQFTLTFVPKAGTQSKYKAYAGTSAGYNTGSYSDINIDVGPIVAVNSASVTGSTVYLGDTATVKVYTTPETTKVKLVSDLNSNDVIESTNYSTSGNQRIFTLSWPIRNNIYSNVKTVSAKVFAGGNAGYTTGYKPVAVGVQQSTLSVISASPSNSRPTNGSRVTINVVTSSAANKVWLYNSYKGNFLETTRYSESNGRRTWTIDYIVDLNDYQTFKAYASDSAGNTRSADFSLNINSESPSIYEAYAKPTQMDTYSTTSVYVTTNTSVSSVSFDIAYGPGSMNRSTVTNYSESGDKRYWENTYQASGQSGTSQIRVTAYSSSGSSSKDTVTVETINNNQDDAKIYSLNPTSDSITANDSTEFTISTGLGASKVQVSINGRNAGTANSTNSDGTYQYWNYVFNSSSSSEQNNTITFTAIDYNGRESGSKKATVNVFYINGDLDPLGRDD